MAIECDLVTSWPSTQALKRPFAIHSRAEWASGYPRSRTAITRTGSGQLMLNDASSSRAPRWTMPLRALAVGRHDCRRHRASPDPARQTRLDVPTKPWACDSTCFFGLTRGLDDERFATWGRRASRVGTVPLHVVGLSTAALAGLFGS